MKFHCPYCNQRIEVADDCDQATGECPACGKSIAIPNLAAANESPVGFPKEILAKPSPSFDWKGFWLGAVLFVVGAAMLGLACGLIYDGLTTRARGSTSLNWRLGLDNQSDPSGMATVARWVRSLILGGFGLVVVVIVSSNCLNWTLRRLRR